MKPVNPHMHARLYAFVAIAGASLIALAGLLSQRFSHAARADVPVPQRAGARAR
jgi:hypothetical protein